MLKNTLIVSGLLFQSGGRLSANRARIRAAVLVGKLAVKCKICGITRLDDARAVVRAGADAMGLMFAERSSRQVSLSLASDLAAAVKGELVRVGMFVDARTAVVDSTLSRVDLDVLQFHGDESGEYCRGFGKSFSKIQGGRSTNIMLKIVLKLSLKLRIGLRTSVEFGELIQRVHQRLGDKSTAMFSEMSGHGLFVLVKFRHGAPLR